MGIAMTVVLRIEVHMVEGMVANMIIIMVVRITYFIGPHGLASMNPLKSPKNTLNTSKKSSKDSLNSSENSKNPKNPSDPLFEESFEIFEGCKGFFG